MERLAKTGPIFTDLYELTMAQCYFAEGITDEAAFSLFVRGYPENRNYYVSAGLEEALAEICDYTFSDKDLAYLDKTGLFTDDFLDYLNRFRFTGTVRAMPEGSLFFADEPVMEVSAPIIESQLLETYLINTIGFSSLIATKAARCVHAARGRNVVDFSLRRNQGIDAGVKVARSCHIAGFAATSNVLAGKLYGIPVSGTMAHSFVSIFENEYDAFRVFSENYPDNTVLLIDTHDTIQGAENAAKIGIEMKKKGLSLAGVRLDSGDMAALSRQVRRILDGAGLTDATIFASSGFDEYKIDRVLRENALIDAFGVGTKLGVSADAPYLDMVYKLVHFGDRDITKQSPGKAYLAGEKQVFRKIGENGMYTGDIIGAKNETIENAVPMLETIIENGKITAPLPDLADIRRYCAESIARLDETIKAIDSPAPYPVSASHNLLEKQKHMAHGSPGGGHGNNL